MSVHPRLTEKYGIFFLLLYFFSVSLIIYTGEKEEKQGGFYED